MPLPATTQQVARVLSFQPFSRLCAGCRTALRAPWSVNAPTWTTPHLFSDICGFAASNRVTLRMSDYLVGTGYYWTSDFSLSYGAISTAWFVGKINKIIHSLLWIVHLFFLQGFFSAVILYQNSWCSNKAKAQKSSMFSTAT